MKDESDLHDQIMLAFRDYFKAVEKWERTKYPSAAVRARNALGIIRILARKRRIEIQKLRKEIREKRKGKHNGKDSNRSDN